MDAIWGFIKVVLERISGIYHIITVYCIISTTVSLLASLYCPNYALPEAGRIRLAFIIVSYVYYNHYNYYTRYNYHETHKVKTPSCRVGGGRALHEQSYVQSVWRTGPFPVFESFTQYIHSYSNDRKYSTSTST